MSKKLIKRLTLLILVVLICPLFFVACKSKSVVDSVSKNLSTYNMDIVYNDDHTLNVSQELKYRNNSETILEEICFHLYPKAFTETATNQPVGALNINKAYPNGKSYGDIEISSVAIDNDNSDYFLAGVDSDILNVKLDEELEPDDYVTICFEYKVIIPNVHHRFGYGENTINVANFYPIACVYENGDFVKDGYHSNGDPFYSDVSNYNVNITYNKDLTLATSGNVIEENLEENTKTSVIKAKAIRDFAFVLSDKFNVISDIINGITVNYYYYDDINHEYNLKTSIDSIATFSKLFAEYPYSVLNVVKTNFVHGGMEYPNLVYISDEVTEQADYTNVIVHEIAHQWWYGVVGNNEFESSWLDEGLTEYSTVLFYEKNPEYNVDTIELKKTLTSNYVTFVELYTSVLGSVDTSMNRKLNEYSTEPEYVYVTYVKGLLFFDGLREIVGDNNFFKSIQEYYNQNKFKNAKVDNLLYAFESVCKTSLEGFFNSWIEGLVVIQ